MIHDKMIKYICKNFLIEIIPCNFVKTNEYIFHVFKMLW